MGHDREPRVQSRERGSHLRLIRRASRAEGPGLLQPGRRGVARRDAQQQHGFRSGGGRSRQEQWLRADLAASAARCIMAVFHQPRFFSCDSESGCNFQSPLVKPFWDALCEYGADLVIAGHRHRYERFAPQDAEGNHDPDSGIRQIIVGTGGASVGVSDLPRSQHGSQQSRRWNLRGHQAYASRRLVRVGIRPRSGCDIHR